MLRYVVLICPEEDKVFEVIKFQSVDIVVDNIHAEGRGEPIRHRRPNVPEAEVHARDQHLLGMNFPVAGTLSGRELRRLKHSRSLAAARQRDKLEKLAPSGCFGGLVGREELRQRRQMFSRVETGAGGDDATFAFGVWYVTNPLGPGGLLPALDASPSVAERALAETQRKRSLDVLRQARETCERAHSAGALAGQQRSALVALQGVEHVLPRRDQSDAPHHEENDAT